MQTISFYRKRIVKVFLFSIIIITIPINTYRFNSVSAINLSNEKEKDRLIMENYNFKNVLENMLPVEKKTLFEEENRGYDKDKNEIKTYPLKKVISKGVDVEFKKIYDNPQYSRPIYTSDWKDFWFRDWVYFPKKVSEASHNIFIYPLGASSAFDFEGSLGFNEGIFYDAHKYINILIYNFKVEYIKQYKNQIILIGKPTRKGAEIISILQDNLLLEGEKEKECIFQLSTKGGYVLDHIYGGVINYKYLKELIEKNSVSSRLPEEEDYMDIEEKKKSLEELRMENLQLKKKLSYYIPLGENLIITNKNCKIGYNNIEYDKENIKTAVDKGDNISFAIKYSDSRYKRPIYDPSWKENYKLGWAYMPTKLCQYMHKLFVIPKDKEKEKNLMGSLAFDEKYRGLSKDEVGLLVYNFQIKRVVRFKDRIILLGEPKKIGCSIISIKEKNLTKGINYIFQMITLDNEEIDAKYLYCLN
ncbi:hypothetical protein [Clostridium lundense]|uniref:hypothetical protein n=1 Tax=Clostridium lundense TaxID=319475 RepID=UPI000487129D|nr:hypothetical protein [Clostridium lundense]